MALNQGAAARRKAVAPAKPKTTKAAAKRYGEKFASPWTARGVTSPGAQNRQPHAGATPTLTLPNGTPTVTPVAPPTIDPFLTPTDTAQEAVENQTWDDYLTNLDLTQAQQDIDVGLKTGQIDQALTSGLDATDWNSAARGLQSSSIKDQSKAQMIGQSNAARNAETDKQGKYKDYVAGQHKTVDTVYKPAIKTKYDALKKKNADEASAAWAAAHPATEETPAADAGAPASTSTATFTPTEVGSAPAAQPGLPQAFGPTVTASGSTPDGVVKDGKFYHVYNRGTANERWVYVRPAGG